MIILVGFRETVMNTKPIGMPGPPEKHRSSVIKLDTVSTDFSLS